MKMDNITNTKAHIWRWWLAFGIVLMLIGLFLLSTPILTSLASVFIFGVLLVSAGIVHIITAILEKHTDHLWLHLVIAGFTIIIGIMMLLHPSLTLMALTLLIAVFFLGSGLFRIIGAITARFQGFGWYLLSGIISLLLGFLILIQWPLSSLWIIGLFIGIDFIFAGWSLIMISLLVKKKYLSA